MTAMMYSLFSLMLLTTACGASGTTTEKHGADAAAVEPTQASPSAAEQAVEKAAPDAAPVAFDTKSTVAAPEPAERPGSATSSSVEPTHAEPSDNPSAPAALEITAFDHGAWNAMLQAHVSADGVVNYGGFAKDARLATYLAQLSAAREVNTWPRNERLAFWINTYNAFTIKLMLDHPTVKSIKDIDGPWKKKFFSIGGEQMNLDHVEHMELREKLGDERIHFAVVCASFSCPQLWNKAFTAEGLDKQLDDAARRFINDPKRNTLGAKPKLSSIFDWFGGDFTKKGTLIAYLNKYASTPVPADARVGFLDYDWSLNGKR